MASRLRRLGRTTVCAGLLAPGLLALNVVPPGGDAAAAPIVWAQKGAFETCLEGTLDAWLKVQAELLVNEDPAAGKLDDQAVAGWAAQALAQCKTGAGAEPSESTDRFIKYVARWRQHIYDLAAGIRQKGGSD